MIAVVGATGNTGRAAVRELIALGENPLCVVRNPDKLVGRRRVVSLLKGPPHRRNFG